MRRLSFSLSVAAAGLLGGGLFAPVAFAPSQVADASRLAADIVLASRHVLVKPPLHPEGKPALRASSAMVVDQMDGRVLYTRDADAVRPIASITKLMTALVVLDAGLPMDELITIFPVDMDTLKYSRSRLREGTALPRSEMLRVALMASENRAAAALGRTYPGGTAAFVEAMNRKAAALRMKSTHFADPTGLSCENVSTAADLVKLVRYGYRSAPIREYTTTPQATVAVPGSRRILHFGNSNALVGDTNWRIGLSKTGYIQEAGPCLVMQAQIAERPFIIVLLDAPGKLSRLADARRIRRWLESAPEGVLG